MSMKFEVHRCLSVDGAGIHCIGLFKILSDDDFNGKYFGIYFTDEMIPAITGIKPGEILGDNHLMHTILERYPEEHLSRVCNFPEDALMEVFKQLYIDNDKFKKGG